jgi:hypothetical protein
MITIKKIKGITKQALTLRDISEAKQRVIQKKEKRATDKLKEKNAKYLATELFPSEIEKAAKDGMRSYSIDMGESDDKDLPLKEKYVKKYLKDFHPVFAEVHRSGYYSNYDGDEIDNPGHWVMTVSFSW